MNFVPTFSEFSQFVPSFSSSDDQFYQLLSDALSQESVKLSTWLGDFTPDDPDTLSSLEHQGRRTVSLRAALGALSSFDLVLTPTGFGVVSTSNVSPASSHRVSALRDELRVSSSDAYDGFVRSLLLTSWRFTPEASFLWSVLFPVSTLARRYGLLTPSGSAVYHDDLCTLEVPLSSAYVSLESLLSSELLSELLRCELLRTSPSSLYGELLSLSRHWAVAYVSSYLSVHGSSVVVGGVPSVSVVVGSSSSFVSPSSSSSSSLVSSSVVTSSVVSVLTSRILSFLSVHGSSFPVYLSSSLYRSRCCSSYSNSLSDSTYFF